MTYRRSDDIGKEENRESTKEFTEVGSTNNDLSPIGVVEHTLGKCRGKRRFEVSVEVKREGT